MLHRSSFVSWFVVPASVLSNWAIEFEKFAPHLNLVKYHGSEREEIKAYLDEFLTGKASRRGESLDVILAPITYVYTQLGWSPVSKSTTCSDVCCRFSRLKQILSERKLE